MSTQSITIRQIDSRYLAIGQVVLATLFIALCAGIRIPLPFTPVPLSLQTFAIMLVGGTLGSRKGALAVVLYLAEALIGLPVLTGWRADPTFLLSPVAGYLVGFVFQAYVTGLFSERAKNLGQTKAVLGYFLASFFTLGCGALWLSRFVGAENAILLGVIPFLPGDILKVGIAAVMLKHGAKQE